MVGGGSGDWKTGLCIVGGLGAGVGENQDMVREGVNIKGELGYDVECYRKMLRLLTGWGYWQCDGGNILAQIFKGI